MVGLDAVPGAAVVTTVGLTAVADGVTGAEETGVADTEGAVGAQGGSVDVSGFQLHVAFRGVGG